MVSFGQPPEARIRGRSDAAPSSDSETGFSNEPFKKDFTAINVSDLAKFDKGSKIGPQELVAAGIVRKVGKHGVRVPRRWTD